MAAILSIFMFLLMTGLIWAAVARCPLLRLLFRSFDGWADLAREQREARR